MMEQLVDGIVASGTDLSARGGNGGVGYVPMHHTHPAPSKRLAIPS